MSVRAPIRILLLRARETLGPIASATVARRRIQGMIASKVFWAVNRSSSAPAMPPAILTRVAGFNGTFSRRSKSLRYAHALANTTGNNATVLVALATTDGTPVNTNVGNVMNDPPPATELIKPPMSPADNNKRYTCIEFYFMSEAQASP